MKDPGLNQFLPAYPENAPESYLTGAPSEEYPWSHLCEDILVDLFRLRDRVFKKARRGAFIARPYRVQMILDYNWITHPYSTERPLPFNVVCESLGLDPGAVAKRYLEGKKLGSRSGRLNTARSERE